MNAPYLLGVDIGTYSSKGVLVAAHTGEVVAEHSIEHALSMPGPGRVEHDAAQTWWGEFVSICRAVIASSGIDPKRIQGVGVSGIGPCVLPVDEAGQPLRQAILYGIDTRASHEIARLEQALGRDVIFKHSATHLSSSANGPKIVWVKDHEPEVYAKARWFLTSQSFIVLKLTGAAVMDHYTACTYAPLLDVAARQWRPGMDDLIVPTRNLPTVSWSCEIAGSVTRQASLETGLVEGTPVIAGTMDSAAEAISAGVTEFGDMMMMFGSSNSFILKTDRLVPTEQYWALNWLEPDSFAFVGGMSTVGSLTRWFRDQLSPLEVAAQESHGVNAYTGLARLLEASPPGAQGLIALPYFEGERTPMYDPDARGMFFGLTLKHTRADLYRALLEGVGFGIRHNMDGMLALGIVPRHILAIGGGVKNLAWMQTISDIANIEMSIPEQQVGSAYGDAFLAGIGVGLFSGVRDVRKWVRYVRRIKPNPESTSRYAPLYNIYRELYERTSSLMSRLAALER